MQRVWRFGSAAARDITPVTMFDENAGTASPSRRAIVTSDSPLSPVRNAASRALTQKRRPQRLDSLDTGSAVGPANTKPSKARKSAQMQEADVVRSSDSSDLKRAPKPGKRVAIESDWPKKKVKTTRKSGHEPAVLSHDDTEFVPGADADDSSENESPEGDVEAISRPQTRRSKRARPTDEEDAPETPEYPEKRRRSVNAIKEFEVWRVYDVMKTMKKF